MKILRVLGAVLISLMVSLAIAGPAAAATVKYTVNGQPITDIQISQRAALLKVIGGKQSATEQLIEDTLQLQEAERLGIQITDADIDDALLNFARNNKMSVSNLTTILTERGAPMQTLRDLFKASIAWNRVTATVLNARIQVSEADIDKEAKQKLTAANSFDYILKEVLFLMPNGQGSASKRSAEASQYKKSFNGCDSAVQLSLSYTDAAVRDLGRRHATQLPEALAAELAKLNVGGITKPRVVEGGVSMLAVCAKSTSEDTTFIANTIRQDAGNNGLKTEAAKYLADLRAKAQIIKG